MLTKATKKDFLFIYQLYMHPSINPFLLYEPMDEKAFVPIFMQLIKDGVLYIFINKNKQVGMCKLVPLTYRSAHCVYCGGVAIHPNYSGQGLGKKMMLSVKTYTVQQNYVRIELSVAIHNLTAIAVYEKVGFEKIGVLKKYGYLKAENKYVDEWLMQCML
jgi:putative acetyltransferase